MSFDIIFNGTVVTASEPGASVATGLWFMFPQITGLGRSPKAQRRLGEQVRCNVWKMLEHKAKSALAILGSPDDLKFCSSLTLFRAAASDHSDQTLFEEALKQFYDGSLDAQTMEILGVE